MSHIDVRCHCWCKLCEPSFVSIHQKLSKKFTPQFMIWTKKPTNGMTTSKYIHGSVVCGDISTGKKTPQNPKSIRLNVKLHAFCNTDKFKLLFHLLLISAKSDCWVTFIHTFVINWLQIYTNFWNSWGLLVVNNSKNSNLASKIQFTVLYVYSRTNNSFVNSNDNKN